MIKVNGHKIELETFGDNTLKCKTIEPSWLVEDQLGAKVGDCATLTWAYDNDAELFAVCCLAKELHEETDTVYLELPYIPHARQDRKVSGRLFTLKVFAEIINSLNFKRVYVLDPHSDVSTALIDRVRIVDVGATFYDPFYDPAMKCDAIMFPDAGAAKKYGLYDFGDKPIIIGNKHRNKDGRIESYELMNFPDGVESVCIIDDIVSYAGTHVAAARALKEKGVKKVILIVSHCEYNIAKGDAFNSIDTVYTTDSLLDINTTSIDIDIASSLKEAVRKGKLVINQYFR